MLPCRKESLETPIQTDAFMEIIAGKGLIEAV